MNWLLHSVRKRGLWLNAEEALIILAAVRRAHVNVTEPGADVIQRFMIRCEELQR